MENVTGLKCYTEDMDVEQFIVLRGRGALISALKLNREVWWSVIK